MVSIGLACMCNFVTMWSSTAVATWLSKQTVQDNSSKHIILMSAQCRRHKQFGYPSSHFSYEQVFLSPHLLWLPPCGLQWASCEFNSKWKACCWPVMVEAKPWALCGNCVVVVVVVAAAAVVVVVELPMGL